MEEGSGMMIGWCGMCGYKARETWVSTAPCSIQVSPCSKTSTNLSLPRYSLEDVASLCEHLPQRRLVTPFVLLQGLLHVTQGHGGQCLLAECVNMSQWSHQVDKENMYDKCAGHLDLPMPRMQFHTFWICLTFKQRLMSLWASMSS